MGKTPSLFFNTSGIILISISLLVLMGWQYNIPFLTSIQSNWPAMKVETALCFMCSGCILLLLSFNKLPFLITIFSLIILLIAGVACIEYIFNQNIGVDLLFIKDISQIAGEHYPGRMQLIAAINFIFVACGFLFRNHRIKWLSEAFGLLIFFMTLISFNTYIYSTTAQNILVIHTAMAMHAIALFILLSFNILLINSTGLTSLLFKKTRGGYYLRFLLPCILFVPMLLTTLELQLETMHLVEKNSGDAMIAVGTFILLGAIVLFITRRMDYEETRRKAAQTQLLENEIIFHEITEQQKTYDLLTGLLNRSILEEELGNLIEEKLSEHIAIIILDIDRFRLINEAYGHDAGDLILRAVAERLRTLFNNEKINASRLGGDKFILYFHKIKHSSEATQYVYQIQRLFKEPFHIEQKPLSLTIKLGIALYPEDGIDSKVLIKNADLAVANARNQVGNKSVFFTKELPALALEKLTMQVDLREAIKKGQFFLHYQPQVNLITGKICGAEALARWKHPTKGLISPADFIKSAEESGLIILLNEHIMRLVFQQIGSNWQGPPISINISAKQFREKYHLVEYLESLITELAVNPRHIELEITESMLMEDTQHTVAVLGAINQLGFQFAIDDFGTGFSSFSYIHRIPAKKVKIDRSFITNLPNNEANAEVVKSMIAMLHSLKKIVVAEGAETKNEINFLKQQKCDAIQGFYFHKPLSFQEFLDTLAKE